MRIPLLAVALLVLPHAASAQEPLALDAAAALALINQPLLVAQQSGIEAVEQNALADAQLPDPRLKLGVQNWPTNNLSLFQDGMTQRSIGVEQAFPREEKRRLRGDRGTLEAKVGAAELENLKRQIRRDARLAWIGVWLPTHSAWVVGELLRFLDQQKDAIEIAHRAGRANLHDIVRAQVEIDTQKDRRLEFDGQAARARAELVRWIGEAARRPLAELPPARPVPDLDDLRAKAEAHPQMAAALAEIALADNDVAQARAASLPDWSLEVAYSRRGPQFPDMVSLQVGIELPLAKEHRQDRRLASRLAVRAKQAHAHDNHRRMLMAELESAHAEHAAATRRLAGFETDILPQAKLRAEAALAAYQGGRADLAAVLEARRAALELELQRLALSAAAARARTLIDYLAE